MWKSEILITDILYFLIGTVEEVIVRNIVYKAICALDVSDNKIELSSLICLCLCLKPDVRSENVHVLLFSVAVCLSARLSTCNKLESCWTVLY
jgi:hypothetical protein